MISVLRWCGAIGLILAAPGNLAVCRLQAQTMAEESAGEAVPGKGDVAAPASGETDVPKRSLLTFRHFFSEPTAVALCEAVDGCALDEIQRLVKAGANVNARGTFGVTPLYWAMSRLSSGPLSGDKKAKMDVVRCLLELGADPNACTWTESEAVRAQLDQQLFVGVLTPYGPIGNDGSAPIHSAALMGSPSVPAATIVQWMIDHRGDVDLRAQGDCGMTPLHCAITVGRREIVEVLLRAGADVSRRDASGRTPLDTVKSRSHAIALLLIRHGARYYDADLDQYSRYIRCVVGDEEFYRDTPDAPNAAEYREVVSLLTEGGVDLQAAREDRLSIRPTLGDLSMRRWFEMREREIEEASQ